jgi:phospholipase C
MPSPTPEHVVVLMLENRSFDHMLGYFQPAGNTVDGLKGNESNRSDIANPSSTLTTVSNNAAYTGDFTLPGNPGKTTEVDPGHEFTDVDAQLYARVGGQRPAAPNNLGFVDNYRRRPNSSTALAPNVMKCFGPDRVPVLTTLASEFAVCDKWFSSVPGPTWPNRLFVHCGTSDGNVVHKNQLYGMRTVEKLLRNKKRSSRIYAGDIAQSLLLRELIFMGGVFSFMDAFYAHVRQRKLPTYSFIEPDYFGGNATDQHPPHDVAVGEDLIGKVYEALRQSPYWEKSVLVVLYDEHGGLYDHVPPPAAVNPDGKSSANPPFDFKRLGVRVPAVVVSPFVPKGTVDSTVYDHTSITATLRKWFGLGPLTQRDAAANTFDGLLSLTTPRTDAPVKLKRPERLRVRAAARAAPAPAPLSDLQRQLVDLADLVAKEQPQVGVRAGARAVRARPVAKADERSAREYVKSIYAQKASGAEQPTPSGRKAKPGKTKSAKAKRTVKKAKKAKKAVKAKRASKPKTRRK